MSDDQTKDGIQKKGNTLAKSKKKVQDVPTEIICFLESLNPAENRIAISTHDMPDPDGIGAARGLQWLLTKKFGLSSDIYYKGEISHPQNRTMVNMLDIHLHPIEEFEDSDSVKKICVDCTEKNSPFESADIVIDHHRVTSSADISWIESVGSVSTLVFELIKKCEIDFEEEIELDVATSLFLGVRIDTQELISENTTDRDFESFKHLSEFLNRKKLASIINYPLPNYFFELEREINKLDQNEEFVNQKVNGSCFVGCVGVISSAKRDSIVMLVDKAVRMEGIETAVIFGVIGDNLVASIRSDNSSLDVNTFSQSIFGKKHGGGKLGFAGASVPLGIFNLNDVPEGTKEKLWDAIKETVFHKVFHIVTGN
jgi:nanoRNase/pAp phosphatase (c-di-AMP/oligoRNAs hydrolase)